MVALFESFLNERPHRKSMNISQQRSRKSPYFSRNFKMHGTEGTKQNKDIAGSQLGFSEEKI